MKTKFKIMFSPVNSAYVVFYHENLLSIDSKFLWQNKKELIASLKEKGLSVKNNYIFVKGKNEKAI